MMSIGFVIHYLLYRVHSVTGLYFVVCSNEACCHQQFPDLLSESTQP